MLICDININSFHSEISVLKKIYVELIRINKTHNQQQEYTFNDITIECGKKLIDVVVKNDLFLGIRHEHSHHSIGDKPELSIASNHKIIVGLTTYICASNLGFSNSMSMHNINDEHDYEDGYIFLPTEALEEWKFQFSTVYDSVLLDIINLEEAVREDLIQENPVFLMLSLDELEIYKHRLNDILKLLETI